MDFTVDTPNQVLTFTGSSFKIHDNGVLVVEVDNGDTRQRIHFSPSGWSAVEQELEPVKPARIIAP